MDPVTYNPESSILFVFIGSNHKNTNPGIPEYNEAATVASYLSPHISSYLKQVRDETRKDLDSIIWQNKKASELKMNENLVRGREFGGEDPRARYLPSIQRFTGRFFNEGGLGQEGISNMLDSGHHALIIDGLHGFTTPAEPIQLFNCPLEIESLENQKRWRDQNVLTSILLDYIEQNSIQRVFDLTARDFYRDLIDWYDLQKSGVDVMHVFFEEYAGNDAIPEFAKICREKLFTSSKEELLSLQSDTVHETPDGNYIFSNSIHSPQGWAREQFEVGSLSGTNEDPVLLSLKLNESVDIFERKIRNFLDDRLDRNKNNWLEHFSNEPLKASIETRMHDYLCRYPMLSESDVNPLDFCTILDYPRIISKFWNEIFEPIFRSRSELKKHIENINELRNNLKHNRTVVVSAQKIGEGSLIWFDAILTKYEAS